MFAPLRFALRAASLIAFVLLAAIGAPTARAIQLHWSSGNTDTSFTSNTRCVLIVRADSGEVALPPSWRYQWTADSSPIHFVALDSALACQTEIADAASIDPPSNPADSSANQITAHFCSVGSTPATVAYFVLDLVGGSQGKIKVVALDPTDPDSSGVIESNEVTYNGGVDGQFPPAVLRAYVTHPGGDLSVTTVGTDLANGSAISLAPADTSWRLPLTVVYTSDTRAVAAAYLGIPLPSCNVAVTGAGGGLGVAAIPAEASLEPVARIGSSGKFVPAYGIVQPKDFAFYYQQQLGLFHVFYIIDNRVILRPDHSGADSTQRCIGHAWSTDFEHWHDMDSVLTVRSEKWDNCHVWAPTIVQKDLQIKLFYTGVQRDGGSNQIQRIGLATADATLLNDSLKTWTRRDSAVFSCGQVRWANKNTSSDQGRQFRDPYVMADPDSVGRYLMYYVTTPWTETAKMVVGVARSAGDLSAWRDYGPMHSTEVQYTNNTSSGVESPMLISHFDVGTQTMSRWLFMSTNLNQHQNVHFQRSLHSPSDTLAADWLPTTDLFAYLGNDSTVSYWHANEYLAVPAHIGGYATAHEFIAAWDDSLWSIDVNEMMWDGNAPAPYHADFTVAYPSLAAVESPAVNAYMGGVRLLLLGQRPGMSEVRMAVDLPTASQAHLSILDVQGRRVRGIAHGLLPAGRTIATWDGRGEGGEPLQSGVYFVRLTWLGQSRTARLVVLR